MSWSNSPTSYSYLSITFIKNSNYGHFWIFRHALNQKPGIKEGYSVVLANEPSHYVLFFEDMPEVNFVVKPAKKSIDFIHLFCTNKIDFEKQSLELKPALKMTGMLRVSLP